MDEELFWGAQQDVNNNGVPDSFEFTEQEDTTEFTPQGNAFDNAYMSEEAIAKDIPDYKKYKWYKQPDEGYFYSTGEKIEEAIEEAIESNPEEAKEALNEIAEEDNGVSKEDVQPLIKEAEQVTDGDERTSEVNNEIVEAAVKNPKIEAAVVKNPKIAGFLDDVGLANFNEDDVIDEPDWDFDEYAVSDEEVHPEGSTEIGELDFKDPFERMNKKDLKEKIKELEKDIPLTKPTKKDINSKIINDANEGVEEGNLADMQKAYANAKKPTKYEKEAAKAAGLSDYEKEYAKMSKKEKKEINDAIDDMFEEQKKAGDERRAKEEAKERVNKFFKPLQYERKVYANGRNRILPKGTFMSPDGTEYYNPETETIEQVIEEPKQEETKEEKKEKKEKLDLPKFGGKVSFDTPATSAPNKLGSSETSVNGKAGPSPKSPSFPGGGGGSSSGVGSAGSINVPKTQSATSRAGGGGKVKNATSERDSNEGSFNGANRNEHLEQSFDSLEIKQKPAGEIKSEKAKLPGSEGHTASVGGGKLPNLSAKGGMAIAGSGEGIIGKIMALSNSWGTDSSGAKSSGSRYLPFKFFVTENGVDMAIAGTGKRKPLAEWLKQQPSLAKKIQEVLQ